MRALVSLVGFLAGLTGQAATLVAEAQRPPMVNGGFETAAEQGAAGWAPFEQGYALTRNPRSGLWAAECTNESNADRRGATATVRLEQRAPRPIVVEGWSMARQVGGFVNNDYSIYLDLEYTDGTPLWGQTAPFSVGSHGWQRRRVVVFPTKPVRLVRVHALFRHHTGTAWFDDFTLGELDPNSTFDGQILACPRVPAGIASGWCVRDVAAEGPVVWLGQPRPGARHVERNLQLAVETVPKRPNGMRAIRVSDLSGKSRALSVYHVERVAATSSDTWWQDIRRSAPCKGQGEHANLTRIGVGSNGLMSLYPLACVTGRRGGRAVALDPEAEPAVARLGFHTASRLLYAAFDVALDHANVANRRSGRASAEIRVVRWSVTPDGGCRNAWATYYRMFPAAYARRSKAEGIWIPFTDPSTVPGVRDFGIAYHEGDNSVEGDDRLGILSFRYTEPMTWWMPMDPGVPRTREAALELAERKRLGSGAADRAFAEALFTSGSHDAEGNPNVEFQNAPWTNGAVWVLNPNPRLPQPEGQATKASLSYTRTMGDRSYGTTAKGIQDGEYLDSIEGWADVLDFRADSLKRSPAPATFTTEDRRPVIPTWFSVHALARSMRDDLRRRGKLLMANSTPWRIHAFAPLLDVMGTEVNWLPGGAWRPDTDETFCLRRTLCYRKPYLLLQNTNFDEFGSDRVERYFQRCMFYAVFPSMFSVDASTRNYWTQPQWYERDRHLFQEYIPVIRRLSAAGWEPETRASCAAQGVYVERYGRFYLTVFNNGAAALDATIRLDGAVFAPVGDGLEAHDVLTGERVAVRQAGRARECGLRLGPEQCRVLELALRAKPKPIPR
jgi:hypothetical protein